MLPTPRGDRLAVALGGLSLEKTVSAIVAAEDVGCEAALIGEGIREVDGFVAAAAALSATSRIRVGVAMANVFERHPVALARGAASLDRLAPGRTLLGLGRGDRAPLAGALGLDYAQGQSALTDALHILRPLLTGNSVAYEGAQWTAHLEALPPRSCAQAHIPLLLAAVGPRTLRLAGAIADGVVLNYGAAPEYVRWACGEVAEGARLAGRQPDDVDVLGYVLVARTDMSDGSAQFEAVQRTLTSLLQIPDQRTALLAPLHGAGVAPHAADGAVDLTKLAAVGDADAVRGHIGRLRSAGLQCPVLLPSGLRALTDP